MGVFEVKRSLSIKGCPYDKAVAEATYKVIKTEFVNNKIVDTQEQLGYEFSYYVNGSPGSTKNHSPIARE